MNEILGSLRIIRQNNAAAALQALFDHGRLSRAELARALGLNRSSSGHIVADLVAGGLVRSVGEEGQRSGRARAGRPGILLELVPEAALFVGIEIGVEHVTTLGIDLAAKITTCRVEPFDGRAVEPAAAVARAVAQTLALLPADALGRVAGFGIAVPAQTDRSGHVRVAPLLGWRDLDLAALARPGLPDVPIAVENDGNAFAFGEGYRDRTARGRVTLCLVVETGVGGGIVIDGGVFRGGHGLAGEIGHLPVDGAELEELIGLGPILARHRAAGGAGGLDAFLRDVADRAPPAVAIAEGWARHLAHAIVAACRIVDPDRIVLGGSVAALYPLVAARVAHHVETLQAATMPVPEVVVHEAAETGAAFGAACMMHRRFLIDLPGETVAEDVPLPLGSPR